MIVIGGVPSTASGFTAASAGGDVTLTVDTDSNTVMLASGQTITGGAGFDSLSVQGSGIAAMSSTSIEELIFDGSTSEAIVRATGMAGLNTLTFSTRRNKRAIDFGNWRSSTYGKCDHG